MLNELKNLVKQSSIYGIGAVVSPLISFIMLPIYTRYLSPEDYGLLALTNLVSLLLTAIVGLGVRSGIIRIYFLYKTKDEQDSVITSSIIFSFFVSLVVSGLLLILTPYIAETLFRVKDAGRILTIIMLTMIFTLSGGNYMSVLRAEEKARTYTTMSIFQLILSFGLNIFYVVVLERGVIGVLEAGLNGSIVTFTLLTIISLKGKKLRFSWSKLREVLGFGIPIVPSILSDISLSLSDRYFLDRYVSLAEVGLYSIGYRIAAMLSMLVNKPFNMAWPPYMFKVAEKENAREIYKSVLIYYSYISAWVGCALSLFAHEALILIATPPYYGAYKIVPVIVVSYLLVALNSILNAGLHIAKKTNSAGLLFMVSALLNLLFNFLLIPQLGMMGAAISTIISYSFLNIAYFWVSQKYYPIDHDFGRLFKVLGVMIIISSATYLNIFSDNMVLAIIVKSVILLMFPVLLYVLGFYKKAELEKLQQIITYKIIPVIHSLSLKKQK